MNFQDLLAKIKAIDETTDMTSDLPTSPSAVSAPSTSDNATPPEGAEVTAECGDEMPKSPSDDALFGEEGMEECGMPGMGNMPHGMMGTPKQQDSLSLNVTAQGAGGIRDLMDILHNLEKGGEHDDTLLGEPEEVVLDIDEEGADGNFTQATTTPDPRVLGISAVTATGNDLASKGKEALKRNGGGNPLSETLMARLSAHYQSIKERQ